ncbi:MAG: hypothetical protein ABIT37_18200 [Luteolibacter sp.]
MSKTPEHSPDASANRRVQSFEFDSPLWWRKSGIWIVAIFAVVIFLMTQSPGGGGRKRAEQIEAVNNARQIGLALSAFEEKYGKRPDLSTIAAVQQNAATSLNLGTKSSNDFFRQLLASGIAQSEKMFYSQSTGTRKPDNIFTKAEALKKGECGFTYFLGAIRTDNPLRPIAVTPMIPGTDRFDPKPFQGKAVVLRADNSVTSITILLRDGHAVIDGRNLMDPNHPIWDGHPPVIAWPDL